MVHAPHKPDPQPNLVPVRPTTSRSTQSSGISFGTSTSTSLLLIFSFITISFICVRLIVYGTDAAYVLHRLPRVQDARSGKSKNTPSVFHPRGLYSSSKFAREVSRREQKDLTS